MVVKMVKEVIMIVKTSATIRRHGVATEVGCTFLGVVIEIERREVLEMVSWHSARTECEQFPKGCRLATVSSVQQVIINFADL